MDNQDKRRERTYVIVDEHNAVLGYADDVDEAKRLVGDIEFRMVPQAAYMTEVIQAFLAREVI